MGCVAPIRFHPKCIFNLWLKHIQGNGNGEPLDYSDYWNLILNRFSFLIYQTGPRSEETQKIPE